MHNRHWNFIAGLAGAAIVALSLSLAVGCSYAKDKDDRPAKPPRTAPIEAPPTYDLGCEEINFGFVRCENHEIICYYSLEAVGINKCKFKEEL